MGRREALELDVRRKDEAKPGIESEPLDRRRRRLPGSQISSRISRKKLQWRCGDCDTRDRNSKRGWVVLNVSMAR